MLRWLKGIGNVAKQINRDVTPLLENAPAVKQFQRLDPKQRFHFLPPSPPHKETSENASLRDAIEWGQSDRPAQKS